MHRVSQLGLSLIELVVTLAILSIFMLMGLPNLTSWMQNRQIRTGAESMLSGLQLARAEAVRRNQTVQFASTSDSGWTVGCSPVVGTTCPATIQARSAAEGSPRAVAAASQVLASTGGAASSPVFSGSLTFDALGRVLAASLPSGSLAQFSVSNPTGGACVADGGPMRCLRIVVSPAGQTRMCDPAMASGDARAC